MQRQSRRNVISGLLVLAFFGLFTWGFSYNMFILIGFSEPTAQLSGLTLGLISIIVTEGAARLRLRRMAGGPS